MSPESARAPEAQLPSDARKTATAHGSGVIEVGLIVAVTVAVVLLGLALARPKPVWATWVERPDVVCAIVLTSCVWTPASPPVGRQRRAPYSVSWLATMTASRQVQ